MNVKDTCCKKCISAALLCLLFIFPFFLTANANTWNGVRLVSAYACDDHVYAFFDGENRRGIHQGLPSQYSAESMEAYRADLRFDDKVIETKAPLNQINRDDLKKEFYFMIDPSKSVRKYRGAIREIMKSFMESIQPGAELTIYRIGDDFSRLLRRDVSNEEDRDAVVQCLNKFQFDEDYTSLYKNVLTAWDDAALSSHWADKCFVNMILITDGMIDTDTDDTIRKDPLKTKCQEKISTMPEMVLSTICLERWNDESEGDPVFLSGRGRHVRLKNFRPGGGMETVEECKNIGRAMAEFAEYVISFDFPVDGDALLSGSEGSYRGDLHLDIYDSFAQVPFYMQSIPVYNGENIHFGYGSSANQDAGDEQASETANEDATNENDPFQENSDNTDAADDSAPILINQEPVDDGISASVNTELADDGTSASVNTEPADDSDPDSTNVDAAEEDAAGTNEDGAEEDAAGTNEDGAEEDAAGTNEDAVEEDDEQVNTTGSGAAAQDADIKENAIIDANDPDVVASEEGNVDADSAEGTDAGQKMGDGKEEDGALTDAGKEEGGESADDNAADLDESKTSDPEKDEEKGKLWGLPKLAVIAIAVFAALLLLLVITYVVLSQRKTGGHASKDRQLKDGGETRREISKDNEAGREVNVFRLRLTLLAGDKNTESGVYLLEKELVLGSGSGVDIRISDPDVDERHARIFVKGENILLEDLGSRYGTALGGMRIYSPNRLRDGDEILLGNTCFQVFMR